MDKIALLLGFTGITALLIGDAHAYDIRVYNNCPYDLWVQAGQGNQAPLQQVKLAAKIQDQNPQSHIYSVTVDENNKWDSGRVYGCWKDTAWDPNNVNMSKTCGFAEQTVIHSAPGVQPVLSGTINSNVTFVDYLSIPIKIATPDGKYCINNGSQNNYFTSADLDTCPSKAKLSRTADGKALCMTAAQFCNLGNDDSDPQNANYPDICENAALLAKIHEVDPNATILDLYGCSGGGQFQSSNQICAALNRGVSKDDRDQGDYANFYKTSPYNRFSAYVHDTLKLSALAFPFDDYPPEHTTTPNPKYGEYVNCQSSTYTEVTFCPDPVGSAYAALGDRVPGGGPEEEDSDRFVFTARKGERVDVKLLPVTVNAGGTAVVRISRGDFAKRVRGTLPLEISDLQLPAAGRYRLTLHNLASQKAPYVGQYEVDITSSRSAWKTLKATANVE